MKQVGDKPKLLKHMFGCKEKEFKRFYGEFALNKTKSEAIIVQHNEYFNVSIVYVILGLFSHIIISLNIPLIFNGLFDV